MYEASGHKKFALLALLIRNNQIKENSVLLWDEPENSLNPELIPKLVEILLELSRNGVQIFIATHSSLLVEYFYERKFKNNDEVMFYSLYKDNETGGIKYDKNECFNLLSPNRLREVPVKLYEEELKRAFGDD